jgi:hypothetical protein
MPMQQQERGASGAGQDRLLGVLHGGVAGVHLGAARGGQVVADGVGDDEVAVRQPLHERRGAEPVGPVVREVRLPEHEQPRQVAHELVVHPEAAHGVVDRRVDPHRHLVRVLACDVLVHVEEIAIALFDHRFAQSVDGVAELEVHAHAARPHPTPQNHHLLGTS